MSLMCAPDIIYLSLVFFPKKNEAKSLEYQNVEVFICVTDGCTNPLTPTIIDRTS